MPTIPERSFFACATTEKTLVFLCFSLTLWGVLPGCSPSTFELVQPPRFAQQIGSDHDTTFQISPLTYRLRAVEDHLVIRIYNTSDDPITFLGAESYVVDPQGQSHALPNQTIAPQSFIKLILPPLPPDQTPAGPSISLGVSSSGIGIDAGQSALERPAAPHAAVDKWTWPGEGLVRLSFRFRHGSDPPFTHSFSLRRHKR
jgi:hypothetical protein